MLEGSGRRLVPAVIEYYFSGREVLVPMCASSRVARVGRTAPPQAAQCSCFAFGWRAVSSFSSALHIYEVSQGVAAAIQQKSVLLTGIGAHDKRVFFDFMSA